MSTGWSATVATATSNMQAFATAADRAGVKFGPGDVTYLIDRQVLEFWDGSAWQDLAKTTQINPFSSIFVPWDAQQGNVATGLYGNPLLRTTRNGGNALNLLLLHLLYSGPTSISIDYLDASVQTAGAAGSISHAGIYTLSNQSNPFAVANTVTWATLTFDAGTVDCTTTGGKTFVVSPNLIIPASTWFAVGAVDQVAASTRVIANYQSGGWSPWGIISGPAYSGPNVLALGMSGVTGALPANFVPSGVSNVDAGIGMHRIA
jgi:hypothetical protein